jgi:methyl-accepting chemotaxis protein
VDLSSLVLAPLRVPLRVVRALDDLSLLAERAAADPHPLDEVRDRLDALLAELRQVTEVGRSLNAALQVTIEVAEVLSRLGENLDVTGQQIVVGGRDLNLTGKQLDRETRELIDGGAELTEVARRIELDLQAFRALLPRVVDALDTVERLEGEVETVAGTMEPLQGAAERVGRVTQRLSRSSS